MPAWLHELLYSPAGTAFVSIGMTALVGWPVWRHIAKWKLARKLSAHSHGGLVLTRDHRPYKAGDGPFCENCFAKTGLLLNMNLKKHAPVKLSTRTSELKNSWFCCPECERRTDRHPGLHPLADSSS